MARGSIGAVVHVAKLIADDPVLACAVSTAVYNFVSRQGGLVCQLFFLLYIAHAELMCFGCSFTMPYNSTTTVIQKIQVPLVSYSKLLHGVR